MTPVRFVFESRIHDFRPPNMGNQDEIAIQRVNRRSRGGDLILFRDNEWPKVETLNMTFDFLTEAEGQHLLLLVKASIGSIMTYRDHENKVWSGYITNPDTTMTQNGRNSFQIPIVFEGTLV